MGQPEKTALYRVIQEHLLTFEQQWTDEASGRTLPKFVLDELHGFMSCGILAQGFAHLFCESCGEHHVVAFSCKARAVCPSCLGRPMFGGRREPGVAVHRISPRPCLQLSASVARRFCHEITTLHRVVRVRHFRNLQSKAKGVLGESI